MNMRPDLGFFLCGSSSSYFFLDRMAADIRDSNQKRGRKVILKRAELIRAAVDALEETRIDLTKATSEEDCKELITECLKRGIA
jgi:hypothetical protein